MAVSVGKCIPFEELRPPAIKQLKSGINCRKAHDFCDLRRSMNKLEVVLKLFAVLQQFRCFNFRNKPVTGMTSLISTESSTKCLEVVRILSPICLTQEQLKSLL